MSRAMKSLKVEKKITKPTSLSCRTKTSGLLSMNSSQKMYIINPNNIWRNDLDIANDLETKGRTHKNTQLPVSQLLDKIFQIRFQFWKAERKTLTLTYNWNFRRKHSRRYALLDIDKVEFVHNFVTRALRIINEPSNYRFSESSFPMGIHLCNLIQPFFLLGNF